MEEIAVIENARAAEISLHPVRSRLLAELAEPGTATSLGSKIGLSRQKVTYHLRALELHGLIECIEERRNRNTTEKVFRSVGATFVISPETLASVAPNPDRAPDQLSAMWLLALASRMVREVGALILGARRSGQSLASFGVDSEINFSNAEDRATFVAKLSDAIELLISEYHAPATRKSRKHRLIIALHPSITNQPLLSGAIKNSKLKKS